MTNAAIKQERPISVRRMDVKPLGPTEDILLEEKFDFRGCMHPIGWQDL